MSKTVSKTAVGAIVTIFVIVANYFGIVFPEGTQSNLVEAVSTFIGVFMLVWGQLSRKDLNYGIFRK